LGTSRKEEEFKSRSGGIVSSLLRTGARGRSRAEGVELLSPIYLGKGAGGVELLSPTYVVRNRRKKETRSRKR
jgi:hypothetical protein